MKPRIYVDTSVIGGCFDGEFDHASKRLMDGFESGNAVILLSEFTLLELQGAPPKVASLLDKIPTQNKEQVEFTQEASNLAELYIHEEVIGEAQRVDAQHIAIATVFNATHIVSWNFKHIVNLKRIQGYNSVNMRCGYNLLEIRSPLEIIDNE